MEYVVLKPFNWAGESLRPGQVIDIPASNSKASALVRSKFIREGSNGYEAVAEVDTEPEEPEETPLVEQLEHELADTEMMKPVAVDGPRLSPQEMLQRAKARAAET